MRNTTFCKSGFSRLVFFILFATFPFFSFAQVCGTPGVDGPVAVSSSVNTYYPITGNVTLSAGAQSVVLAAVPATDQYSNNFGTTPISAGDLILIIQMQDASINYNNSTSYGSGTTNSGPDNLGGTGFTSLGNSGIFEYVIATNNVPLTGGNLTFKGTGTNGGMLNNFYNADPTTTRGKKTFQIVRVPQYSNLTLTANITTPPFNGVAGGVIAFNVSGTFNFSGYTIDGSARGFRGGYSPRADSGVNNSTTYVGLYTDSKISGKGEGIAGTPKYMWDGFNQVVNAVEGLPGGSSGRGAAANAGGGGNDHNTGGGGGGNGGFGGLGGAGWQGGGGDLYPALTGAGRPGSKSYVTTTTFPRLIMGGGGGAGDANDASSGVKGGVGGAIILINAGNVSGNGTIYANGGKGAPGTYSGSPDGAGGGGAGGTVLLNVSNNSTANIKIEANGGAGGNTENDNNNEHGPGGGGGGGIICHNVSSTVTITASVLGGAAGKSNAGNGINHGAVAGTVGYVSTFTVADVPPNLQVNANCFPVLETKVKTLSTTAVCNSIDEKLSYEIEIKNTGSGNAAGVLLDFSFPTGIEFDSATATYSTGATGPAGTLANSATANNPVFGGFNIAQNGVITITLVGKVAASIAAGTYSANAQALYLDPTRTTANSTRRITAFTNAYGTVNKTYEGTNQSNVPGVNFNGTGTTVDDISILALPAAPTVSITQTTCTAPTGRITVNTPANGSGISYTLTGTNPISAPINNTTGIFSGLVPGVYSVTTTNAQGCTSAANTGIVVNAVDGAPTTTGVTICQGETGSLTASSPCAVSSSIGPLFGKASNVIGTGSFDWSNVDGANSIGSGNASASLSSNGNITTRYLAATNFGFAIPSNAKIKGISLTVGRYASANGNNNYVIDNAVRLIKGNAILTADKKTTAKWSTSSTSTIDYGGESDLWSNTWTPDEINNAGFGIALSATINKSGNNTVTAYVDYMQITVSYTIGEIEWYVTSTGGSSIYTGSSFNPVGVTGSGLANTTTAGTKTYYAACSGNSNCRAAVNFVINAKPTITGTTPASRCGTGEVTLGATSSGGTINWYAAATGGSPLETGESFTTPSLSATTSYYVEATDNGCTTPTRTEVKATINSVPTIDSVTEGSICGSGSVKLTASASAGATINWYASPTSATILGTGTIFNTPTLSATTTYYVGAVTSLGCTSASRIAVAAVINNASTIAFTSGTQNPTVCSGASVPNAVYTFGGSATNATVSNLPAGLTATVNTNAKTVTISGNPTAAGTYTITTVGHTAPCTEVSINGTVTITPNVAIAAFSPATSNRCQGAGTETRTTTATNSTAIIYSLDAASISGGNTINATTGAITYVASWSGTTTITASATGCNGPVTTTHAVTVNPLPTATITGNLTACLTTTLTANSSASPVTYVWYKDDVVIAGQTNKTLTVNQDGGYKVKIRNTTTGCEQTSATSTVKVSDTQKPVKPTLADITAECSTTVTRPTTTDNCAGTVTGTTSDPLTYNAQGTYTINWSFADGNGNTETATQKVIIKDTQKPVKPTLADITGECSTTVTRPTTTDNCAGTVTGTTSDPLTYSAQGTYTINWSFADGNGNTETATQKVIIKDTQKPLISCPTNVTVSADANSCVATGVVLGSPTTSDNCTGAVTVTNNAPASFPLGNTTVTWTATDVAGNTQTCTQIVTVNDTQKPSIICPTNVTVSADVNSCVATGVTLGTPTTSDNCTGAVTVTNNAPSSFPLGNTTVTWTVTDAAGNAQTCTQILKVIGSIEANDDTISSSKGISGGVVISNIFDNDILNCNKVNINDVDVTVTSLPSVLNFDNATGAVSVKPNTPTGTYTFDYSICEIANNANCNSATVTVKIVNDLVAVNDDFGTKSSGSSASNIGNVKSNDTLGGAAVTAGNTAVTVSSSGPLSVDANGNVTLAANTPSGTYSITYQICEKNADPANCETATAKVKVLNAIDAVVDSIDPINGNIGGTTISLIGNDTLNANQAVIGTNSGEVTISIVGTLPSGLTLNANGTITVNAGTPKGNYSVEYTICEVGAVPANCDSVTITVPVTAGNLVANADEIPSVLGSNVPQTLGKNVFDNDTKNSQPLNPADVTLKTTASDPKGYLTVGSDGSIVLGANPPAGDYELTYEICEKLNPDNCSSNTVKVTVGMPAIDAVEDVIASINGNIGGKTISLIANDKLNGNPIVVGTAAGEVKFEIVGTLPAGLSLNSDYTITVAPNTPAANYNVEYKICENTNPLNCDSVVLIVPVKGGKLIANEDLVPAVGVNVPQEVINVFANDTKDGNPLVPSDVNLTVTKADPKGYLTVDANGNVTLAPNAPAGEYELTYEICEKLNSNNCDSNVVKVTVTEPKMTVVANSYCSNNVPYVNYTVTPDNFVGNNLLTIRWIDSNNNVVATQTNQQLSGKILWPGAVIDSNENGVDWPGWVLNNGIWTEGADGFEATRNGVKMEFSLNPTVTVSVAYPSATSDCNARPTFSIKANNDETGPINVKKGANATVNIFENDVLNGAEIKPSDVILSVPVVNPNFSLNANGSINIAANTPDGVYELTYQICEAANTSNCAQAIIKITVNNVADPVPPTVNEITLNNDNDVSADGINGSLEFINVLENDLINGQPINPADVIVKPLIPDAYFEWNADGTVSVKPNTPGNTYTVTYQVCEKANPSNCATATLNVFVEVPAISVVKTAVFNDENKSGFANAGETITYKFTVTNTGNVPLVGITINDPLPGVVVSGQAINLGVNESNETNFTAVYKITQEDINRGSVSNQAIANGSSVRGVMVEDKSDDASNSGDNPTVLDLNGCSIKVMNAFSPNGDSKNARFYIRGIECYPENTVEIYNRWGVLVFNIDQYNNNDRVFVGYSNGRSTIKQTDGLPVGTYFYILKYKDGAQNSHQESGYLYLNK